MNTADYNHNTFNVQIRLFAHKDMPHFTTKNDLTGRGSPLAWRLPWPAKAAMPTAYCESVFWIDLRIIAEHVLKG